MVVNQKKKVTFACLNFKSSGKESAFIFLICDYLAAMWPFSCFWHIFQCCFYKMKKLPIIPNIWHLVVSKIYYFLHNLQMFPVSLIFIAQEAAKARKIAKGMTKTKIYKLRSSESQRVYPNSTSQKCRFWKCPSFNQSFSICWRQAKTVNNMTCMLTSNFKFPSLTDYLSLIMFIGRNL